MPKLFPPSLLQDPEAQAFCLQKQLTNIDSLRHHLRESVCLGIDTEGCEGINEGITSMGVAILPPMDCTAQTFRHFPLETQELVDHCGIESYCFYVEGRNRRKPHPLFPFGFSSTTPYPGEEIKAIVDKVKKHYTGKDIVLVGWHPHPRDFPAIKTLIPSLFQEFVGWADVIDIIQQTCISKQEDLLKSWPSLSDVMLCVGFSQDCLPQQRFAHGAGTDAIHTVLVLARLLTYDSGDLPVELWRQRPLRKWRQQQQQQSLTSTGKILQSKDLSWNNLDYKEARDRKP